MTKKLKILLPALFSALIISLIIFTPRGHFYKVKVFDSGSGWGYDILVRNKPYIHQPYIPAVEGEDPFPDKSTAERAANLVIKKLRAHKIPYLTKEEIDSLLSGSPSTP